MKILIAPNAFKGTIEANEAAEIIQKAILEVQPKAKTMVCPIADGGDGTCFLLGKALGLEEKKVMALDAIGRPLEGLYFFDEKNKTAYLDVSTVSGIKSLKNHERNPWLTSTFGTGLLIKQAIETGTDHIVLGLGGSATIDLGLGIMIGLGYKFLDEKGREIPVFSENFLKRIRYIQSPIPIPNVSFTCLCDVNNKFFGQEGAIPVFGPQKGLVEKEFEEFESVCSEIVHLLSKKSGKVIVDKESYGAAGGIAYGLSFFFPVTIQMGASWFFNQVDLESKIHWADWVITGEGKYDSQSSGGKGSYELLQLAKKQEKKVILITSGPGGRSDGFGDVIQLPDLDFSKTDFKETAKKNLLQSIEKYIK
ncbi:glycerate kinase [Shivajiella indica]|uniref:Glycerate kinase n=1 Tax=Shivajiella indica TaxID=872115 RepID=A0ABW5B4J4_9BACT